MPDNSNGEAITYVEQQLRPAADAYSQAYYRLKTALDEWTLRNLGTLFPADSGLVLDQNQFAHPLTNNDVLVLIGVLSAHNAAVEANSGANLAAALTASVNPTRG